MRVVALLALGAVATVAVMIARFGHKHWEWDDDYDWWGSNAH